RPDDLAPPDWRRVNKEPGGQRKNDGGHDQRLDDRAAPVIERDRLRRVADQQCGCAEQPPAAPEELDPRTESLRCDAEVEAPAPLLQRRRDGEQERRDESEGGGHPPTSLGSARDADNDEAVTSSRLRRSPARGRAPREAGA